MKAITYVMRTGFIASLSERASFLEYVRARIHQKHPGYVVTCRWDPALLDHSRVEVEQTIGSTTEADFLDPAALNVWIEHRLWLDWLEGRRTGYFAGKPSVEVFEAVKLPCPHCGHEISITVAMRGGGGGPDPESGS